MSTSPAKQIRILLVDDHVVIRTALRILIESQESLTMVGEAGNRREALEIAASEQPDIILLDIDLGGENGLDFISDLLGVAREARIVVLTGVRDPQVHQRAVSLGAMGLVQKDRAFDVLVGAIERVNAGDAWLDPSLMARVLSEMSGAGRHRTVDPEAAKIATRTDREREVLTLIGQGLKNKEIADQLFISEWTVRHHITSIFAKLEVSDRVELILYAYKRGLADPPRSV
jgi:two-component system, NarL family, nitrate/nitrite response regulator NarL